MVSDANRKGKPGPSGAARFFSVQLSSLSLLGRSIQQEAVDFALNLGAESFEPFGLCDSTSAQDGV